MTYVFVVIGSIWSLLWALATPLPESTILTVLHLRL